MEGKRFLHSIQLQNILSFGPDTPELTLEPLNVLIGPNASGKSNLIEALSLLAAAPRDLQQPIRAGGGVREWLWKGVERLGTATLEVTLGYLWDQMPLRYRLSFTETVERFDLKDEAIENKQPFSGNVDPYFYYRYREGRPVLNVFTDSETPRSQRRLMREDVKPDQSILSQRRDPDNYPELTLLGLQFERMKFYREWSPMRAGPLRQSQQPDLLSDFLAEDASNLGLVLSDLLNRPDVRTRILGCLSTFYPAVADIRLDFTGGRVRIFLHETGLRHSIPATRLSDGTLRYLCLLAVLCHPSPPPVICIEEPELGLHPDMIPEVAKLLVEATSRTQLFVTTHSDILVDALSDTPEAIIVCEKSEGVTQLQRLNAEELKPWLAKYRLGEIWTSGHIGGNRW